MAGLSDKNAAPDFSGMLPTPRQIRSWSLVVILVMLTVTSCIRYVDTPDLPDSLQDLPGISEGTELFHETTDDNPFSARHTPN